MSHASDQGRNAETSCEETIRPMSRVLMIGIALACSALTFADEVDHDAVARAFVAD